MSIFLFQKGGESYDFGYDPDIPPLTPGRFDDEFSDGVITGWSITTEDNNFSLINPGTTRHLSESVAEGYLLMQNVGETEFYKTLTGVSGSDPFTVVVKLDGYPGNALGSDVSFMVTLVGPASNVYYQVRITNYLGNRVRIVYANGGGGAEGTVLRVSGVRYIMIQHDGNKQLSSWVSANGIGWDQIEDNRYLSSFSSFNKLCLGMYPSSNTPVVAVDFVRWWDESNIFVIGRT